MTFLEVGLFGQFRMQWGEQALDAFETGKTRELFCYLLLHRNRPHPRELLAGLLWSDAPASQSKKYLRQSLWQLRSALDEREPGADQLLLSDEHRLGLNPAAALCLDVAAFEEAYERSQGIAGQQLDSARAGALRRAADLYRGDLLEDWYQDWCLFERERLQNMYLIMLDKLMAHCEANRDYESAIDYGVRILQCDRSREHTHRSLMRLQYMAGDRTGALHQFERCTVALQEDLGVEPARSTATLYEQIRADDLPAWGAPPVDPWPRIPADSEAADALRQLDQLGAILGDMQRQIMHLQQEIGTSEATLGGRR